jgi:hypothetical protein
MNIISKDELTNYNYRGARALVLLHEQALHEFAETWKNAKTQDIPLPTTKDPNYTSYATLMRHVLFWARDYMVWICEQLELPDPKIDPPPAPESIEKELDSYMEHLIAQWRKPLEGISKGRFFEEIYKTRWFTHYCIEAMLEHAVMHLKRHQFQFSE